MNPGEDPFFFETFLSSIQQKNGFVLKIMVLYETPVPNHEALYETLKVSYFPTKPFFWNFEHICKLFDLYGTFFLGSVEFLFFIECMQAMQTLKFDSKVRCRCYSANVNSSATFYYKVNPKANSKDVMSSIPTIIRFHAFCQFLGTSFYYEDIERDFHWQ